ncbi:MAG: hypothetical protein HUJ98_08080, partial [Bacteroidaceae bacterium]|nr:hypothetical protein [Bacteroidaceae bacterium]
MRKQIALTTITVLMLTSCQQQEVSMDTDARNQIVASIDNPADSRTVVDDETGAQSGAIGIMWTDGDQIGVFDNSAAGQKQYNKVGTGDAKTSAFAVISGQTAFSNPKYAYYPYDSNNNGKGVDQLNGTVPTTQSMDA